MSRIAFLAAFFGLASTAAAQSPATRMAPGKGWLSDLNKAKTQAAAAGKPLMIVFRCDP